MYPVEPKIKDTTESNTSASFQVFYCQSRRTVNFTLRFIPFLSSNIPSSPAYFVFISPLINTMRSPSPKCYATFLMMTIYSDTPRWSDILHKFLTLLLIWASLLNLTFWQSARCFHRTFATGAACQQRTLTPPDTCEVVLSHLGLASVRMLRLISPELVLFPDFSVSNIPRYFCFAKYSVPVLLLICMFYSEGQATFQ